MIWLTIAWGAIAPSSVSPWSPGSASGCRIHHSATVFDTLNCNRYDLIEDATQPCNERSCQGDETVNRCRLIVNIVLVSRPAILDPSCTEEKGSVQRLIPERGTPLHHGRVDLHDPQSTDQTSYDGLEVRRDRPVNAATETVRLIQTAKYTIA